MSNLQKILNITLILILTIVLSSFISWHLGYTGFLLIGNVTLPTWSLYIISFVLFAINTFFNMSIILDIYDKSILKICVPYMLIYLIAYYFLPRSIITSTVLPMIYVLIFTIIRKDFKNSSIRAIKLSVIECLYQAIMLTVKTQVFQLGGFNYTPYQELIFSVDLIILLFILYCKGGLRYALGSKLVLLTKDFKYTKYDSEDVQAIESFQQLQGWRMIGAITVLLGLQIVQWFVILFVCSIGNLLIEGLVISAAFICYGFVIKRRWHSKSIFICTGTSTALFYACARIIPPFEYSQFLPVIISLLLIYALHRYSILSDHYNLTKLHEEQENKDNLFEKDIIEEHYKEMEGLIDYEYQEYITKEDLDKLDTEG